MDQRTRPPWSCTFSTAVSTVIPTASRNRTRPPPPPLSRMPNRLERESIASSVTDSQIQWGSLGTDPGGLGNAHVRCVVAGGKNDKVGDAERPSDVDKVLEAVGLGLLCIEWADMEGVRTSSCCEDLLPSAMAE